jgi:predicted DNA-binding transcriptional regulator AlpA
VAEWQTRQTQNLLLVREWGFKSLHPHQHIVTRSQVSEKIGLSVTEIDRKEAAGKFLKRVQVGFRVFWVDGEVDRWMEALIEKRNHAAPDQVRETTTTHPPHKYAAA